MLKPELKSKWESHKIVNIIPENSVKIKSINSNHLSVIKDVKNRGKQTRQNSSYI